MGGSRRAFGGANAAAARSVRARAVYTYVELELETGPGISIHNIMPQLREHVERSGVKEGFVNVLSRCAHARSAGAS